MKLQMQSIHFTADKKLLDFIQKKMDKLDTFFDKIIDGDVILRLENDEQKGNKHVHLKINIPGTSLMVKENNATFEEAVDEAVENLKNQLKKTKEKMSSR
ncbi:MAG TPA: ribosome-associated translation inhibitor RaiA [Cytophagaceae bacterium]|jgi:putative sigma-54 modulation protein|nr:ribosome-associated translation inhibitor RaiA [Cytophagaceae bacterium]